MITPLLRTVRPPIVALLLVLVVGTLLVRSPHLPEATAQEVVDATPEEQAGDADAPRGFFEILFSGGLIVIVIVGLMMLLSLAAVALVVEHAMNLRPAVLMPDGLAEGVRGLLGTGRVAEAIRQCRGQPSVLAHILHAGLEEVELGWNEVEKSMEEAVAEESARLFRKIEYLSLIGNISPMMGLLGTVIGIFFTFQEVALTQGIAGAGELARGIYPALITTVIGLIVAIPSVAAFAIFRNRIDEMMAEATHTAQSVFIPFKRAAASPPQPPAPPES